MKALLHIAAIALLLVAAMDCAVAQLDSVGGPYAPDANTRLLLHFDGDYTNDGQSADAVSHGNPLSIYFLPNTAIPELDQCLRIQNDSRTDSAYLTVADTSTLDLTGSWTIEGWVNIFTFGGISDWRWVPRLVIKPGDTEFWQPNYFVEMWGDVRKFSCGYYTPNPIGGEWSQWPQANSPNNSFEPTQWVHLTFIRDTTRHFVATLVHDANRTLLFYSTYAYDPAKEDPPVQTSQPVHIGWAGAVGLANPSVDSWLDGFVDEIRISDVVRPFPVPPIVGGLTQLMNQPSTLSSYEVQASMQAFIPGATIASATIRFDDGTGWAEVPMTALANNRYTGQIPGRPLGTRIRYYVVGVDSYGLRAIAPSSAEFDSTTVYSFVIYQPNTMTLHLSFEEGPGNLPLDHSPYQNPVTTFRIPDYSSQAKVGNWALLLLNDSTKIDSNWVEVNSPFLASDGYCVDLWFNADSIKHATRLLNLPTVPTEWNANTYEISFRKQTLGAQIRINGRYQTRVGAKMLTLESSVQPVLGAWYHVIMERNADTRRTVLVVRDSNDVLLSTKAVVDSAPVIGSAPLRVGRAATRADSLWYIPPFRGRLDEIKIYNYPAAGITDVERGIPTTIPHAFALEQNYPNPFNPATSIRFSIPQTATVRLVIYNILGQKIRTLVDERMHAGEHTAVWDAKDGTGREVGTGVYLYALRAGEFSAVRKMMVVR